MDSMMRIVASPNVLAFFAFAVLGQPTTQPPTFEVASVKPSSKEERMIGMMVYPGGRVTVTNYTLRMLIEEAYSIQYFQISGGPKWADEERFSIIAKPPDSSASSKIAPTNPKLPPPEEERLMLRTLLTDRFQLKIHNETAEGPVFRLVVGSRGPKLEKTKDPHQFPVVTTNFAPESLGGYNATMKLLAARLADLFRRPVIDQTGLEGAFDFKVDYTSSISDSNADNGPPLSKALAQIGLKLVAGKGPILHLVIDHAVRPTEN